MATRAILYDAAGRDDVRVGEGQVVHKHVMIPDSPPAIAHDAVHDSGDAAQPHLQAALLLKLTADGVGGRLAELDEAAGKRPLAHRGLTAPADEQHAVTMKNDRPDANPGMLRILPAHAEPASQASVAYRSRTSASMRAVSSAVRPPAATADRRSSWRRLMPDSLGCTFDPPPPIAGLRPAGDSPHRRRASASARQCRLTVPAVTAGSPSAS